MGVALALSPQSHSQSTLEWEWGSSQYISICSGTMSTSSSQSAHLSYAYSICSLKTSNRKKTGCTGHPGLSILATENCPKFPVYRRHCGICYRSWTVHLYAYRTELNEIDLQKSSKQGLVSPWAPQTRLIVHKWHMHDSGLLGNAWFGKTKNQFMLIVCNFLLPFHL